MDKFKENNLAILGSNQEAAMLKGSKAFAKNFMKKYEVQTAKYKVFQDTKVALKYLRYRTIL